MAKKAAEEGKANTANEKPKAEVKKEEKPAAPVAAPKAELKSQPINKELQKELQKQQKRLSTLEAEINKATSEKNRLEQAMAAPENYADKNKFNAVESEYKKAHQTLKDLNKEYEGLFEKVMELEMQM